MGISFHLDLDHFMSEVKKLDFTEKLPEFVSKTLAARIRDVLESRIRDKIGNGGFGQELAGDIRTKPEGTTLTVDHKSDDTTHIAEHVINGGVIRPKRAKFLAIPIDEDAKDEWPSTYSWTGKPIFLRRKRGPGWVMAEKRGKDVKGVYALVPETKPQRPRPFWMTEDEALILAEKETASWLKTT